MIKKKGRDGVGVVIGGIGVNQQRNDRVKEKFELGSRKRKRKWSLYHLSRLMRGCRHGCSQRTSIEEIHSVAMND